VPALTTTSYAVLALLALQPWTTYQLARQMERSLGWIWPRAVSRLYEEPKKLVVAGLATSRPGATGRRPSTVYTITPAGRRALTEWLSEPGAGQAWQRFSAALNAEHIHAPLLMQSAQLEQPGAMELFTRLADLGKPVEAIVYADEFHQKYQPRHRLAVYQRNLDWFDFWLRGVEDPDPSKTAQYVRWRALRRQHDADLAQEQKPAGAATAGTDPALLVH